MLRYTRAAVCVVLAVFATAASAQNYPSGPVKLIVPIPAGGVTDVMARVIGQRLQEIWGKTVVVENRPGGNSGVGAQAVERAPADGLTLLVAPDATFSANPALFSKLIYDPDDFTPISVLCRGTPMLIVHPSLPVRTVPEFVAYAKANPGKLNYGSFGIGTYSHLSMEDLKQRTGMDLQHVPYRGAAPALNGFLGNEVSVMIINLSSVEEHAKGGEVRLVALLRKSGCLRYRTYRPFPRQFPPSIHRCGSGCGGQEKCRLIFLRRFTPMCPRHWIIPRPRSSSGLTGSSASISRRRISGSSFKATSSIGAL